MIKVILLLILIPFVSRGQIIPMDSAKYHEGYLKTVCGIIISTYVSQGDKKITFLNFGHPHPNETFTLVIWEDDLPNFKYKPAEYLKDKNVCVMGKIKLYKGKPEMIIKYPNQIREQ